MNIDKQWQIIGDILKLKKPNRKFYDHSVFGQHIIHLIKIGKQRGIEKGYEHLFKWNYEEEIFIDIARTGVEMEITTELLGQVNKELAEASAMMKKATNDVNITYNLIIPEIKKMIDSLRSYRMTTVGEIHQTLNALKDVRKFFLDNEHLSEIQRLKEFIDLAERLKILIENGTMDVITDIILKLEVKGEEK